MHDNEKQKLFLELYEPHAKSLSAFAMALEKNKEAAKDLVSETLLRAYETFDNLRDESSFKSYIFSISSRIFKRRKWRLRFFGEYDEPSANEMPDYSAKPEVETDVKFLYEALDKLSFANKQAIVLYEISGFSIREISEIQKVSESAVKSRLKRSREKLSELLGGNVSEKKQLYNNSKTYDNGAVIKFDQKLTMSVNNEK